MARKVFISVLGFTNYSECIYTKDAYKSHSVRFIQEATLEYLLQQYSANTTIKINDKIHTNVPLNIEIRSLCFEKITVNTKTNVVKHSATSLRFVKRFIKMYHNAAKI